MSPWRKEEPGDRFGILAARRSDPKLFVYRRSIPRASWAFMDRDQVALETVDELYRATERDAVAAVDLVRCDAQALSGDPADERGREESVLTAQEDPRGHVRPHLEGRWLVDSCFGLCAPTGERLGRKLRRHVVIEESDRIIRPSRPSCSYPVFAQYCSEPRLATGSSGRPARGGPPLSDRRRSAP